MSGRPSRHVRWSNEHHSTEGLQLDWHVPEEGLSWHVATSLSVSTNFTLTNCEYSL